MRTKVLNSLLADMSVFVQVTDHGSFAEAARIMGMTPSALSRQVSRLENALSNRLLERTTRQLRLTEFGQKAYVLCRNMIDSADEVIEMAQTEQETPQGVLRVSAPRAFGIRVVHPLIHEFLNRYPDIDIQFLLTDRVVDPVTDQLDLIMNISCQPNEGYVSHKLYEVRQRLCASPDYLSCHGTPLHPTELNDHQCIMLGELSDRNCWTFTKNAEQIVVNKPGRYSVNHTEARLDSIKNGYGIAALPDFTVDGAIERKEVVEILTDWNLHAAYRGFVYIQHSRTKHVSPKASMFVQYLKEKLGAPDE